MLKNRNTGIARRLIRVRKVIFYRLKPFFSSFPVSTVERVEYEIKHALDPSGQQVSKAQISHTRSSFAVSCMYRLSQPSLWLFL